MGTDQPLTTPSGLWMSAHHQHDLYDPRLISSADLGVVPSELDGMAGLLSHQMDHYASLQTYAVGTCGDTDGLTGLMRLLSGPVSRVSQEFENKYRHCSRRMDTTVTSLHTAKKLYVEADAESARRLAGIDGPELFDQPPRGIGNFQVPASWRYAFPFSAKQSYTDKWVAPARPDGSAGADMNASVKQAKNTASGISDMWDLFIRPTFGQSVYDSLVEPIVGDYTALASYSNAYHILANTTYSVAENERRGLVRIGPRWNGAASSAFEWEMVCWDEGTGGLGDICELVSQGFKKVYDEIEKIVRKVIKKIEDLVQPAARLRQFLENHPDAWAHLILYPICTPSRGDIPSLDDKEESSLFQWFHAFARAVGKAVHAITTLTNTYEAVAKKVDAMVEFFTNAHGDFTTYVTDTVLEKGRDHVLNFERGGGDDVADSGWNPRQGAWRVLALPS